MKKIKKTLIIVIAALILLGIYYYAALPPLNIHSAEVWVYPCILYTDDAGHDLREV